MSVKVELVSAERRVWSGEATIVLARTAEGDLGIMANHAPLLGVLVNGVVSIKVVDGSLASSRNCSRRRLGINWLHYGTWIYSIGIHRNYSI